MILSLLGALRLAGQAVPPSPDPRPLIPGSELTVTLITIETGERLWERFGHNSLWLHNALTGADDLYDYGRFSFEKPHFVLRFLQGRMWYSMGHETDVPGILEAYARAGRKIWAQELDLTPAQRAALQEFLVWNWRPENREYFYDYYRDNCSTRIRDALDKVLGGAIRRYGQQPSSLTWRDETRRLNENHKLIYTGMLLALGRPVDEIMSRWEQMFLPMRLREHLDSLQVVDSLPTGSTASTARPLVKSARVISPGGRWPVPDRPTSWLAGYLIVGVLLGGLVLALGATRAFLPAATLWLLVLGALGLLLTYLSGFSRHVATYRNENLLLCNVLSLAAAVLLPSALRGRSWAREPARKLVWLLFALVVLALGVTVVLPQHNAELIALLLPVQLGVLLGLERRLRGFVPA